MLGIIDSGIGGLAVCQAVETAIPELPVLYLGDLAHFPYGNKSNEAILEHSLECAKSLVNRGARAILVASSTIAATATVHLRRELTLPVFETISPAVAEAVLATRNRSIGVIGSQATVNSNIFSTLITREYSDINVYSSPCPLLVSLIEEGWIDSRETRMVLRRYLRPLKDKQIDTLILGCNHALLLKKRIQKKVGRRVRLINPAEPLTNMIKVFLQTNPDVLTMKEKLINHYYVTDLNPRARALAKKFYDKDIAHYPS